MTVLEHDLFTAALWAYLAGTAAYFYYVGFQKAAAASFGKWVLAAGAAAHAAAIVLRGVNSGHAPFSNMFESLSFFAWGVVLIFLFAAGRYGLSAMGAFTAPLAVLIMGYASLMEREAAPLVPALQSYWLWIHVITCFAAYAGFAVSFSSSLMYFGREHGDMRATAAVGVVAGAIVGFAMVYANGFDFSRLSAHVVHYLLFAVSSLVAAASAVYLAAPAVRKSLGAGLIGLFPASEELDRISYWLIRFGFPFLTVGIITGAVWANYAWGRPWSWDPKETWSLITWFVYLVYLHARVTAGWKGRRAAFINVVGFVSVIFTFVGVNFILSGLHSYA
ncbi:MAG: c-type cytochrome biogenesis protein CcsB [bacterium]